MYTGPKLTNEDLVFGYDTGYGVADNTTDTRFYPGEPTTNATPSVDFLNMSNWTSSGWSGSLSVSTDYDNTIEMTSTNGWRTHNIDTGITSGGTVTVSYEYKIKSIQTSSIYMLNLNGTSLGNYTNGLGNISNADTTSGVWKTFTSSWTANSDSKLALGLRGADSQGLTDTIYVRNLQVELNSHATPYTSSSRSDTASLIDLKRTTNIDVSNVSFDSTGQPTFDGTSDSILVGTVGNYSNIMTVEAVFKTSSSASWKNILCGTSGDIIFTVNGSKLNFGSQGSSPIAHANYSTTNVNDGEWHYGVATYNGSQVKIYVDGVLESTNSRSGNQTPSSLRAGSNNAGTSEFFNGDIPLVKLYNRVLTAAEITNNYNAYKNRFNI
jgi:hypothetical protein